jgi:hypothetical protein
LIPRLWEVKRGPRKASSHLPKHLHLASPDGGWSRRNPLWAPLNQKYGVSY